MLQNQNGPKKSHVSDTLKHLLAHLCNLHGGLICIAFCLLSVVWPGPKVIENNSYLKKYYS